MDKLTQLIDEYNNFAKFKEEAITYEKNKTRRETLVKDCDRQMDKLKKEISEESKNDN